MVIKKIFTDVSLTIVEWVEEDTRRRCKLPFNINGEITEDMLTLALPYEIVWSEAVLPFIKSPETIAEDLDKILYNNGIFTRDDLRRANPNRVHGMLLQAYGIDYNKFMKTIENFLEA